MVEDNDAFQWVGILPNSLRDKAYQTGREFAWYREDALEAVKLLGLNGLNIFGVDVWLPTVPGPTALINDWDPARRSSHEQVQQGAFEFIKNFSFSSDDHSQCNMQPVFNIWAEYKAS